MSRCPEGAHTSGFSSGTANLACSSSLKLRWSSRTSSAACKQKSKNELEADYCTVQHLLVQWTSLSSHAEGYQELKQQYCDMLH
eukprot:13940-Heterococcus_DN1.PRE.2